MAMPQTVPPKEKASETFAFEFQKTQRISLQTLLSQRARPLSQSLSALPAPPKWEPLAVPASFISLPRPLPLGEVDLRSKDGEGEDADLVQQLP